MTFSDQVRRLRREVVAGLEQVEELGWFSRWFARRQYLKAWAAIGQAEENMRTKADAALAPILAEIRADARFG